MASAIPSDQLYSGRATGSVLIIPGLYSVLWGKTEEKKIASQEREDEVLTKPSLDEGETKDTKVASNVPESDIP